MRIVTLGVGCDRNADADELRTLARATMAAGGVAAIDCIATLDTKNGEAAVQELARALAVPLRFFSADALRGERGISAPSDLALRTVGTPSVAEAAALAAAGSDASLLVAKQKSAHCTAALAISTSRELDDRSTSRNSGTEPA